MGKCRGCIPVTSTGSPLAIYTGKPGDVDVYFHDCVSTSCRSTVSSAALGRAVDRAHD
jgi:hypothetical protein